jgi:hypothetical protein
MRINDNQCIGAKHTLKTTTSTRKIMAAIFWDRKDPLLDNFLPRGDTINAAAYCEALKKLCRAIQNKWRGMLRRGVCLQHDNARPHTALATQDLLQSFKWEVSAPSTTAQTLHQATITCFLN